MVPSHVRVWASDGNIYGTTRTGGQYGGGTVFRLDDAGQVSVVHAFGGIGADGLLPLEGVIQGADGALYGTTEEGPFRGNFASGGVVFRLDLGLPPLELPPTITSAYATTFSVGIPGTFTVTTTGTPTVTSISRSGKLPGGVSFVDNGDGTATLAGTPNPGTGGSYPFTITASNGVSPDATQAFTLTVDQPDQAPAITSANAATFTVGAAGTFTVTTSGSPVPATISATAALPAGVTFTNNGDGTATLHGTPGPGTGGVYQLTLGASNGVSPNATQSFRLTVNQALAITSAAATTFPLGSASLFSVTTSGFPVATAISRTGALPAGVTFTNNGDGTATLSGTPAAGTAGDYPFTITASNGVLMDATQAFVLTVGAAVGPDLVELAVRVTIPGAAQGQTAVLPGADVTVHDITRNIGTGRARGRSWVRYYLSLDTVRDDTDIRLIGRERVLGLRRGGSERNVVQLTVPLATPLGVYHVIACADDLGRIVETDETNNCTASVGTMRVSYPDLQVTALVSQNAAPRRGVAFRVDDTTANVGRAPAGQSSTAYYVSPTPVKGAGSQRLAVDRHIGHLLGGGSSSGRSLVTVPLGMAPGPYFLLACADDLSQVRETNEGNNCFTAAAMLAVR